jgi:hypothetical protein
MHLIVSLVWLAGGLVRIYQQARFFQIEEYMNGRYWRWLLHHPDRWAGGGRFLPGRWRCWAVFCCCG